MGKCQDFRVFQGGGKLLWKKPVGKFQDIRNFNDTSEFLCIKGKCLWEIYIIDEVDTHTGNYSYTVLNDGTYPINCYR